MKNYLKDLEKELKKLKISDAEIKEIISDHLEMLEEAKADGISDAELSSKFGTPETVASQIYKDNFETSFNDETEAVIGEGALKGYELFKAFPVDLELKKFKVSLVSEDFLYLPYEGESIQVFAKNLKDPEDYQITLVDGEFLLKRVSRAKFKIGFTKSKSPDFGIKVPMGLNIGKFEYSTVSGDAEFDKVTAKKITLQATSGDFEFSNLVAEDLIKLQTVSGDFKGTSVQGKELDISLVSGDLEVSKIRIDKDITINTVSGDAEINDLTCEHINFRTVSGDFEGEEVYPESVSVKSVSGDFEIVNKLHEKEIVVTSKKTLSGDISIR